MADVIRMSITEKKIEKKILVQLLSLLMSVFLQLIYSGLLKLLLLSIKGNFP